MHVYRTAYDSACMQKTFSEAQLVIRHLKEFFVLPNFKFPIIVVAAAILNAVSFNLYPIEQQVIESKSHRSVGQDFQKNNKGNIPFISRCWHMIYEPNAKTNCILTIFMSCTFCENPWCP